MRRALALLLLGCAVALTAPADAHNVVIASRITQTSIATEGDEVKQIGGDVRSPRRRCLGGRTVIVTWLDEDLDAEFFGASVTDASGNWTVSGDAPTKRRYTFRVRRNVSGPAGHRKICAADRRSATLS